RCSLYDLVSCLLSLFSFQSSAYPRDLHSFPTRRSSDLERAGEGRLRRPVPDALSAAGRDVHGVQLLPGVRLLRLCQLGADAAGRSEEHTSELQSQSNLVCRLLLEKKKNIHYDVLLSSY